jgi:hypothetical protein
MLGPDYEGGPPGDRPARHRTPERSFTTDDSRTYSPYRPPRQNGGGRDGRRPSLSPSAGAGDRSWDDEGDPRQSQERNRSRGRNGRQASAGQRICKKCGEPLTGQFVRALDGTFHLDCFKCRVGRIVRSQARPWTNVSCSIGLWTDSSLQILPGGRRRWPGAVSSLRNRLFPTAWSALLPMRWRPPRLIYHGAGAEVPRRPFHVLTLFDSLRRPRQLLRA